MNPLKMLAEEIAGGKLQVDGLDKDNIHDALADCKNQLLELNHCLLAISGTKT